MRNTLTIASKELKTYFASPVAYIVSASFLAVCGFFYVQDLNSTQLARLHGFFGSGSFLLLLISPILTMRLLAEEQKLGTLELLLTAPVRDEEVVLGKFLAALAILVTLLLFTLYYPLLLVIFADPDFGPMVTGYLGMFLVGACFLAIGLFASSLTSNQIVAAVLSFAISLLFWLASTAGNLTQNIPGAAEVLGYISLSGHFSELLRGVVDTTALVYYLSFTVVMLFLTVRSLETRRWR